MEGKIRESKKYSKEEKEKMKYVWGYILGVKYKNCNNIDTCFNCGGHLKEIYDIDEILWNWMYVDTIHTIMCNKCKEKVKTLKINGYKINIG